MKTTLKRLTALILALSLALSLFSTGAWAADLTEDTSPVTVQGEEEPQAEAEAESEESEPKEEPEAPAEDESEPEAEPEAEVEPEAPAEDESEPEEEPEVEPEAVEESEPEVEPEAPAEESDQEGTVEVQTTNYDVWVGGTQVTDANKDDVLGAADGDGATVKFTPAEGETPATLTLNGANIEGNYGTDHPAAIFAKGMNLTINVTGNNTVTGSGDASSNGIRVESSGNAVSLIITGAGTLNANGNPTKGGNGVDVNWGSFTVKQGATLNATGGSDDSGVSDSYGVYAAETDVNVNGTLNATGGMVKGLKSSYGVYGIHSNVNVAESGNLTATGNSQAIYVKVKNAIVGTGWTDTAGTEGKTDIVVSDTARELDSTLKKVQFPTVMAVTNYPLWVGGMQVTEANKDDVLGAADGDSATVKYTPRRAKLLPPFR